MCPELCERCIISPRLLSALFTALASGSPDLTSSYHMLHMQVFEIPVSSVVSKSCCNHDEGASRFGSGRPRKRRQVKSTQERQE
jgi:hypothetical protein